MNAGEKQRDFFYRHTHTHTRECSYKIRRKTTKKTEADFYGCKIIISNTHAQKNLIKIEKDVSFSRNFNAARRSFCVFCMCKLVKYEISAVDW